jgi:nucleotide-binding universal stress UspA family protein
MKGNIVIATDLSPLSDDVVKVGLEWAEKLACIPSVIHVNNTQNSPDALGLWGNDFEEIFREIYQDVKRKIGEKVKDQVVRIRPKVEVERLVYFGKILDILLKVCNEKSAKLIVIGAKGHSEWAEIFLGSKSEKIIRTSHCPVLVVRGERAIYPKKIFWATDMGELCDYALSWITLLANTFGSEIVLAHVLKPQFSQYIDHEETSVADVYKEKKLNAQEKISKYVNRLEKEGVLVKTLIKPNHLLVGKTLVEMINSEGPDLIVVGTKSKMGLERVFLGSVVEHILHHVSQSCLIVKGPE